MMSPDADDDKQAEVQSASLVIVVLGKRHFQQVPLLLGGIHDKSNDVVSKRRSLGFFYASL